MVMNCIVLNCGSEWYPACDTIFHKFPSEPNERNKWLSIVRLRRPFHEKAKICSLHFRESDYESSGRRLKIGAIPFCKETNVSVEIVPNKCCIPGCGSTSNTTAMFNFPTNHTLMNMWKKIILRSFPATKLSYRGDGTCIQQLCRLHFEEKYIKANGRRMQLAIPTLFSPEEIRSMKPSQPISIIEDSSFTHDNHDLFNHDHDYSQRRKFKLHIESEMLKSASFTWQQEGEPVPDADLELGKQTEDESEVNPAVPTDIDPHLGYHCNACLKNIIGFRYVCVQCLDWDLCGACEARGAHPHHYVLRIPAQRPRDEVRATLRNIRRVLADAIVYLVPDMIPPEIKDEKECTEDPKEVNPSHDTERESNTSLEQECSGSDQEEYQSDRDEAESLMEVGDTDPFEENSHIDVAEFCVAGFDHGVAEVPSVAVSDARPPPDWPVLILQSMPSTTTGDRTLSHSKQLQGEVEKADQPPPVLPTTPAVSKDRVTRMQRKPLTRNSSILQEYLLSKMKEERLSETAIHAATLAHKPRPPPDTHQRAPTKGCTKRKKRKFI